jgi:predicted PurR-regulated permease PerM
MTSSSYERPPHTHHFSQGLLRGILPGWHGWMMTEFNPDDSLTPSPSLSGSAEASSPHILPPQRYFIRLWIAIILGINLFLIGYLASLFPLTVSMIVLGLVLIYVLWVPVSFLEKWTHRLLAPLEYTLESQGVETQLLKRPRFVRFIILTLVYMGLLGLGSIALTTVLPGLQQETLQFLSDLPVTITTTLMQLNQKLISLQGQSAFLDNVLQRIVLLDTQESTTIINNNVVESVANPIIRLFEGSVSQSSTFINHSIIRGLWLVLLITFIFYALLDGETLLHQGTQALPRFWRRQIRRTLSDLHKIMVAFVEGQVLLGFLTGVYMFTVYSLFDVPYALLLSSVFAVAELLPIVGTYVGFTPGILVMLVNGEFVTLGVVFLLSYLWQSVKDNIIQPQIFGNALGLHPVIVLVALVVCAKLGGIIGILLAVPLSGLFVVTIKRLKTFRNPLHRINLSEAPSNTPSLD